MPGFVFYLLVFLAVGVFFLFFHLLLGHFIRPDRPDSEKLTIYECGEPTVGSAWIQFDLRYYVVALLFVVFDVEVAFFFPWAVVFGKANELSRPVEDNPTARARREAITKELMPAELNLAALSRQLPPPGPSPGQAPPPDGDKAGEAQQPPAPGPFGPGKKGKGKGAPMPMAQEAPPPESLMDAAAPQKTKGVAEGIPPETAKTWAWIAFADIMVFFGVLMVGFAYLWRRGDINWIRSTAAEMET